MSIEVKKPLRHFVDISLSFSPNPITGDITVLRDDRAINAALKNIILTMVGEKPFNDDFGSQVMQSLFEFCDTPSANRLKIEIDRSIRYNEPRVEVLDVIVTPRPEDHEFHVKVEYNIVGYEQVFYFSHILTPTR